MKDLLFLSHRIPYPPNKGDKIRSWHVLRFLAERYRVHLGTFIDDPRDWRYVDDVQQWVAESYFRPLDGRRARLRSLRGLLDGRALTLPYYADRGMRDWVRRLAQLHRIERVFVFSSAMAQYALLPGLEGARKVVDFVDVDSDKWTQYARSTPWPLSWVYRREGRRLAAFEAEVAGQVEGSLFVSAEEAMLFQGRLRNEGRVGFFDNGVDWRYFDPGVEHRNPYGEDERVMVFTGAMDYWANVDAVDWFAREVLPKVRERVPEALFAIVGARPARAVRKLEALPGVRVTGAVEDIRPYLQHARFAVAPLRIARGVQNKVLEALAMAKPVLATPAAVEGIEFAQGDELAVAEDASALAEVAVVWLDEGRVQAPAARAWIQRRYDWDANLARLEEILEPAA